MLPLVPVYWNNKINLAVLGLTLLVCGFIADSTSHGSIWSPYYRIDQKPLTSWYRGGAQLSTTYPLGTVIEVNHSHHQRTFNLSDAFMAQHPELRECNELRTYNMPYSAVPHPKNVLILGAGTGNDVAAALRAKAEHIDAVEIDPAIFKLGKEIHPEHPYDSSHVTVHVEDARKFIASSTDKYDLVQFGHLDSQTALSTMSSVRLDNYLYTQESLAAATKHLTPDGVAVLGFAAQPDWLRARLYQMVKSISSDEPLAFDTQFCSPNSIMLMWGLG